MSERVNISVSIYLYVHILGISNIVQISDNG